jgi:hypothetical protein
MACLTIAAISMACSCRLASRAEKLAPAAAKMFIAWGDVGHVSFEGHFISLGWWCLIAAGIWRWWVGGSRTRR